MSGVSAGAGLDYGRARVGAWSENGLASESDRDWVACAGNLDDAPPEVLPLFPDGLVPGLMQRLSPKERTLCLRDKLVVVAFQPGLTLYAAVTEHARRAAESRGLCVVGRISPGAWRSAVRQVFGAALLDEAVNGLARGQPAYSARRRLTFWQVVAGIWLAAVVVLLGHLSHWGYVLLMGSVMGGLFFAMTVMIRVLALTPHDPGPPVKATLPDAKLPVYTVLVPLFREVAVLPQLIRGLLALDYPAEKLDIKLILEEDDTAMVRTVAALPLPDQFEMIVVPAGGPQTKPRALNYALGFARGSLLTIYDGEDIPSPNQLRKAAAVFATRDEGLACLQAVLTFYNPRENWLTRQFTAEYAALFTVLLPCLASLGLPLPLGGTSNHFRTAALRSAGGWDPYNVTEDADLGYRLARLGHETEALASATMEEANTQLWNWMRQRRRWLKGFLHTWLVLMRNPLLLLREVGLLRFWVMQCMSLGVFAAALLHPFLMAHAVWFFLSGEFRAQLLLPLHGLAIGLSGAILTIGYGVAIACARRGLRRLGYRGWFFTLASMPLYWMLMTPAAWMALWDFAVRPHHWHKTNHGLSRLSPTAPPGRAAPRGVSGRLSRASSP